MTTPTLTVETYHAATTRPAIGERVAYVGGYAFPVNISTATHKNFWITSRGLRPGSEHKSAAAAVNSYRRIVKLDARHQSMGLTGHLIVEVEAYDGRTIKF